MRWGVSVEIFQFSTFKAVESMGIGLFPCVVQIEGNPTTKGKSKKVDDNRRVQRAEGKKSEPLVSCYRVICSVRSGGGGMQSFAV